MPLTHLDFDPAGISQETADYNARLAERLASLPSAKSIEEARQRHRRGEGPTPPSGLSPRARDISIKARDGHDIDLRIIEAENPRGVFMHVHGGGWVIGSNDRQDGLLERLADRTGLTCVSVEYRLVPEHSYPVPIDDCEDAAQWLIDNAQARFGSSRLFLGGDSAGAHLCVATLLRLRSQGAGSAFKGACLAYGFFDLSLTPGARTADSTLVINTQSLAGRAGEFAAGKIPLDDPRISPLYADLTGMPPALFMVGTHDPLLDDSLFMHARWIAAGSPSEIVVYAGAVHAFLGFPIKIADEAISRMENFLNTLV